MIKGKILVAIGAMIFVGALSLTATYKIGYNNGSQYGAQLMRKVSKSIYADYDEKMSPYIETRGAG